MMKNNNRAQFALKLPAVQLKFDLLGGRKEGSKPIHTSLADMRICQMQQQGLHTLALALKISIRSYCRSLPEFRNYFHSKHKGKWEDLLAENDPGRPGKIAPRYALEILHARLGEYTDYEKNERNGIAALAEIRKTRGQPRIMQDKELKGKNSDIAAAETALSDIEGLYGLHLLLECLQACDISGYVREVKIILGGKSAVIKENAHFLTNHIPC